MPDEDKLDLLLQLCELGVVAAWDRWQMFHNEGALAVYLKYRSL